MFRAIYFTGTAFHAKVFMDDGSFPVIDRKHIMRADNHAHPAPVALCLVQFQCDYIAEVYQSIHGDKYWFKA